MTIGNKEKTVLITGATGGIGQNLAFHLGSLGYHVIATGRSVDLFISMQIRAQSKGMQMDTVPLDVTDPESIAVAYKTVKYLTRERGIDVLINNAGYGLPGPLMELDIDELKKQFETNVFGMLRVTQTFGRDMMEQRRGKVFIISSVAGRVTLPLFGAYSASKYAVEALGDALRMELSPFGVKVILIEPGLIKSNFRNVAYKTLDKFDVQSSHYQEALKWYKAQRDKVEFMRDKPDVVARIVGKAIESDDPAPRYIMPLHAKLYLLMNHLLPISILDRMFRFTTGL